MRKFLLITSILFTMLATPTFAQQKVVGPLLETEWGGSSQTYVFRMFTPVVDDQHTGLGCTAVSTAQVMKYHNHPERGTGQNDPYTTATLGLAIPSINFGETYYDWDNMLNSYADSNGTEEQRIAVGTLMYHVAASMKTDFNIGSSGNGLGIPHVLATYFGYDRNIERHLRRYYKTDAEWEAIIKQQLDAGLPVIYGGYNSEGGGSHVFVVDGYDDAGRFHINMGYGGSRNGWYFLNSIKYGSMDHSYQQGMRINIKPDQGGTGTNRIALMSFIARNSMPQNELFTANVVIRGVGYFSGGHIGTALVDNNGKIVEVIGVASAGKRSPGSASGTINISSYVPETVPPGQYNLRIVARPTDGEWELVTLSVIRDGVPNFIPFTVTPYQGTTPGGGYGLALTDFRTERTYANHGESTSFTVNYRFKNITPDRFLGGSAGAALVDDSGNIVAVVGTRSAGELAAGSTGSARDLTCTVPATVEPGVYHLRIVNRLNANDPWRIATLSLPNIPNSIDFGVITKGSAGKVTFATADGNGTLTASVDGANIVSGTQLELGKKVIFKAVPNSTHIVADWTVNGVAVLGNATDTLEITHFRSETIVTAIFKEKNLYQKVADYAKATENTVIVVGKNDTLNSLVNIPAPAKEGVTLTIKSATAASFTLRRGIKGNLFTVSKGATLILENIIIHGSNDSDSDGEETGDEDDVGSFMGTLVIVNNGGSLVMNDGAVLRNNANLNNGGAVRSEGGINGGGVRLEGGTFTMNGGSIAYNTTDNRGGGVHINGGTFTMNGGEISGNTAGTDGGGIRIASGTFTMSGGEISGNIAGGAGGGIRIVGGTFTMTGGKISGNTAEEGDGGGIRMSGGAFTMQDGKISGNTALDGGAMDISGSSTIVTMNGGEITGNTATRISGNTDSGRGGGITVWSSANFTMNGGKINGNTAGFSGGGAFVASANTIFNMNGGEISGNTAVESDGGGVRFQGGTFTMNDGKIDSNKALDGGGMDVSGSSTTFNMNGGEINGNTATNIGNGDSGRGGGLTVWSSAKFNMTGGKINGNTAGISGGGLYTGSSTTTISGGEIIGNTAPTGNGIHRNSGTVNITGGVVAGTGTDLKAVIAGTHNLNKAESPAPNNAAIIAWNKPSGTLNYTPGTSTNLTASANATAVWANKSGKLGIQYANGNNTGFIEISAAGEFVTPIEIPQIAKTTIKAHYANKTIILENVPANAKIEIYNLQGKRIYSANPENPKILKIGVQTGFYIVRINNQILRVAVK